VELARAMMEVLDIGLIVCYDIYATSGERDPAPQLKLAQHKDTLDQGSRYAIESNLALPAFLEAQGGDVR